MEGETLHKLETRVLVVAPFGRDAAEVCLVLGEAGYEAEPCADGGRLCAEVARGAAAALVAEEALSDEDRRQLTAALAGQPAWSDFPLLLMTSQARRGGDGWHVLRGIEGTAQLTLLERPLSVATLVAAVRAAVESRRRQYQVGDELAARCRADEAVRRSNAQWQALFNQMTEGLVLFDAQGNLLDMNPAALAIHGIESVEALRRHLHTLTDTFELFDLEGNPLATGDWPIGRVLRGETFNDFEVRVRRADTGKTWIGSYGGTPVYGPGGHLLLAIVTLRDVTRRKQTEDALKQLNETLELKVAERTAEANRRARHLGRLAAELSEAEHRERTRLARLLHDDLQQLLLAAKLRLPVLVEGPGDQLEEHVAKIDELLTASLSTSRDLSHELSPPILQCGTLSEVMDWLAEWFGEKHGLRVAVRVDGELLPVPEHLRVFFFQAARELLTNVAKHSGKMEARLGLSSRDGCFTVQVEDDGEGFDPQSVELRLERPEGFGLFNIQERLEALGGRLAIDSAPGGGGSFRMCVPVGEAVETALNPGRPQAAGPVLVGAPQTRAEQDVFRLLVVDDHQVVREGFIELLNRQPDFEVVGEAADGQEAIRQADALQPDAIIMDVDMPTMNGIEATRRVKACRPQTVVVGLSLHEELAVLRAMTEAGADAYCSKHAPAKELLETLRRACCRVECR